MSRNSYGRNTETWRKLAEDLGLKEDLRHKRERKKSQVDK